MVGNDQQLATMAASFKAVYDREEGKHPGAYLMSHIGNGYVFGREGPLRLFAPFGMPVVQLFSIVQRLTLEPTLPVSQRNWAVRRTAKQPKAFAATLIEVA